LSLWLELISDCALLGSGTEKFVADYLDPKRMEKTLVLLWMVKKDATSGNDFQK
jgi:hypothetical protein